MPDNSDSPGVDFGFPAQKIHGSDDILGLIAIEYALAPPMTTEVEAKGGNAMASNLLGTGPHGPMIRAQTMAQNSRGKGLLSLGQDEFPV
jgi:hypothetical protein